MKRLLLSLSLFLAPSLAHAQAPAVGSISDPVSFATFAGTTPVDSSLAAHDGKIVMLLYFTAF